MQDSTTSSGRRASFGWLFTFGMLRRLLIVVAVLCVFVAVNYSVINYRGQREWEAYKVRLEAKGVVLDFREFIPAPVPDDKNFAMTPFLAPLFDFNPRPLQPGQSNWRDTNGLNRAQSFAAAMGTPSVERDTTDREAGWMASRRIDLAECLHGLQSYKSRAPAPTNTATDIPTDPKAAASALLAALEELRPVLDEFRQASQRPYCRFNIRYDEGSPYAILLPHLQVLSRTCRALQLRASAELVLGNTSAAMDDLNLIFYFADAMKEEPFIISHLIRLAFLRNAEQVVWEGLADRRWSDAQLQALQARFEKINVVRDFNKPMSCERAATNLTIEQLRTARDRDHALGDLTGSHGPDAELIYIAPRGWLYEEQVSYHHIYDDYLVRGFDPASGQIQPAIIDASASELGSLLHDKLSLAWNHRFMTALLTPALPSAFRKTALGQAAADEAFLACALERYRSAKGQYPETLAALMPEFIKASPHDVVTGNPLVYRRTPDGRFVLYSIGWNEKDDGGTVAIKGKTIDPTQGDWVWQYPASTP